MATKHHNVLQFPTRRRRESIADLRARVEVQQLIIDVLCWADPNPVHMLTQKQRRQLSSVSRRTGMSQQKIMRRGTELFMRQEAPVYVAHYDA